MARHEVLGIGLTSKAKLASPGEREREWTVDYAFGICQVYVGKQIIARVGKGAWLQVVVINDGSGIEAVRCSEMETGGYYCQCDENRNGNQNACPKEGLFPTTKGAVICH